jgi:GTP cyclohydrolase I
MTLTVTDQEKIEIVERHFQSILETLGCDLANPSLCDTPQRIAKMYVEELFSGLNPDNFPKITYVHEGFEKGSLIQVKEIAVNSICEHHFLPFVGTAQISYLPNDKILGLSKFNRIVDYFCRRPQLQERLTAQIADCLCLLLDTNDVAVVIEAKHFCVTMRGAQDACSHTTTRVLRGHFSSHPVI